MNRIAVYCGASDQIATSFIDLARRVGQELAEQNLEIIYGGGATGMMGALAQGSLAAGGRVLGVMPEFMKSVEPQQEGLDELFIVNNMHERKLKMSELADAFLALPGGFGTLDELF